MIPIPRVRERMTFLYVYAADLTVRSNMFAVCYITRVSNIRPIFPMGSLRRSSSLRPDTKSNIRSQIHRLPFRKGKASVLLVESFLKEPSSPLLLFQRLLLPHQMGWSDSSPEQSVLVSWPELERRALDLSEGQ